jgi:dTDP-4-dehydrorhamnose reductase
MQKILITGANGFVAFYLIEQLLKKEFYVIATGKGPSRLPFRNDNFVYEPMDYTNAENVKDVFNKYAPEIIIHSGALSKPDECELNKDNAFLVNVTGTKYLLNEANKYKCLFVYMSTDFVFSGEKGMYRETDEREPVNYYGQTKLLAEDEVMKYDYDWSIIRTVLVMVSPCKAAITY